MKEVKRYVAEDGKQFEKKAECLAYEKNEMVGNRLGTFIEKTFNKGTKDQADILNLDEMNGLDAVQALTSDVEATIAVLTGKKKRAPRKRAKPEANQLPEKS